MIFTEQKRNQILSYIVHAGELLQKDNNFPKKLYKYLYLPTWSELYTGILKAAGYLFIDKNLSNIIFLAIQTEYPKEIISYTNNEKELHIWWRTIKNKISKEFKKSFPIPVEISDQLMYMRLITQIKSVTLLGIWSELSSKEIIKKIEKIYNTEYWIVFLWKWSEEKEIKASKKEDINMMEHILNKKIYKSKNNWMGNIYTTIVKKNKRNPELVVYVHSSDMWMRTTQPNWYICIVA